MNDDYAKDFVKDNEQQNQDNLQPIQLQAPFIATVLKDHGLSIELPGDQEGNASPTAFNVNIAKRLQGKETLFLEEVMRLGAEEAKDEREESGDWNDYENFSEGQLVKPEREDKQDDSFTPVLVAVDDLDKESTTARGAARIRELLFDPEAPLSDIAE